MFSILLRGWRKSTAFYAQELQVLRELLPKQSPWSSLLLSQAEQAPRVHRRLVGINGFEAVIPYLGDDSLLIECEHHLKSPTLEAVDLGSGRQLRFFTEVLRGGFLRGLSGYAVDGNKWPKTWSCDIKCMHVPNTVDSWLAPTGSPIEPSTVIVRLVKWCAVSVSDVSPEQQKLMRFVAPASLGEIESCETRLGRELNDQYRELLQITNGFTIKRGRPYELLGSSDLDFVGESDKWIGITPLYEDGYVAMKVEGSIATTQCYLLVPDGRIDYIGDCREHVRDSLLWNT